MQSVHHDSSYRRPALRENTICFASRSDSIQKKKLMGKKLKMYRAAALRGGMRNKSSDAAAHAQVYIYDLKIS